MEPSLEELESVKERLIGQIEEFRILFSETNCRELRVCKAALGTIIQSLEEVRSQRPLAEAQSIAPSSGS